MIAIAFLIAVNATQPIPGADVMARYEQSKKYGTGLCFQTLATGDVQTGATIIQAGTILGQIYSASSETLGLIFGHMTTC